MTWFRPVATLALVATAMTAAPATLLAHARLVKSEPASGAKGPAPRLIRLVFSEEPVLALTRLHLVSAGGDTVALGSARYDSTDEHVVIVDVTGVPSEGTYTLSWATAARDGHASKGSFSFSVAAPPVATVDTTHRAPAVAVSTDSAKAPIKPAVVSDKMTTTASNSIGGVLGRLLGYASLFLIVGVVTFRRVVLSRTGSADGPFLEVASTNAASLGIAASFGSLISTVLKMIQESADMPDMGMRAMLLSSTWGWALIISAIAAIIAFVGFWRIHSASNPASISAWRLPLVASIALIATPAFGSHAIASDHPWIAVASDIVHVGAGSIWLGTLAVILLVGISAALKTSEGSTAGLRVASLVNIFSPMALLCGALVVATGVIAGFIHLPRLNTLWTTPYGSALYRKLIFVVLLFLVGAWNWRRTRPRLAREGGLAPIRRVATLEVVLAATVLGLTAILVALAIPE
jgi:copper transport protein